MAQKNQQKKQNKKPQKTEKGPSEVALRATLPDPYTLQKKHTKKQRKKNTKQEKTRKKEAPPKKTAKIPKNSFSVINHFFFFGWFSKFPFFDTLAQKRSPPKHYKNRGFRPFFGKQMCVTKRPFLDKKTKFINVNYHFLAYFLLFRQHKKPKFAEIPIFIAF